MHPTIKIPPAAMRARAVQDRLRWLMANETYPYRETVALLNPGRLAAALSGLPGLLAVLACSLAAAVLMTL
jgi:hypothetical protein